MSSIFGGIPLAPASPVGPLAPIGAGFGKPLRAPLLPLAKQVSKPKADDEANVPKYDRKKSTTARMRDAIQDARDEEFFT